MKQREKNNWCPIPNTGLMSVPYSNGWQSWKHLDNFSWGEVPNCVIKYFVYLEYDNF